jgi:phosphoserine phosphatase
MVDTPASRRPVPVSRPPVIWDFDGTLLPSVPYDTEQSLMLARMKAEGASRPPLKRLLTPLVVEADRRQAFTSDRRRRLYLRLYPWLLAGTPLYFLDDFAQQAAAGISRSDRDGLLGLKAAGYSMVVVSCGTADLSERVLRAAGVGACFDWVAGNRLRFRAGRISGMHVRLPTAMSKVACVRQAGIELESSAVIGDGYTDLPLLDRAAIPVMIDPTGKRRRDFRLRGYHFVAGVHEAASLILKHRGRLP